MPGVVKSIAYFALPSTFDGMSRRSREVRRMVKLSGCLSAGLAGTPTTDGGVVVRAFRPAAARVVARPEGGEPVELAQRHPAGLFEGKLPKAELPLRYELNNRPDWVRIPVAGIRRLLEEPL